MARIYARRVREGRMTIDQVPERWRDEVIALLGDEASSSGGGSEAVPDLTSMTKHDLLLYAQQHGVTVYESWTKDRIVEAIRAAVGA